MAGRSHALCMRAVMALEARLVLLLLALEARLVLLLLALVVRAVHVKQ